jgi:hypothetical protein
MDELHAGRVAGGCAPRRLLIGEPGEPSQVTPVGAGWIAAIGARQLPAGSGSQGRLQRRGAEMDPSLEMAGTGLDDDTRMMPVGAHGLHYGRLGVIEVDENVAGVVVAGVGVKVDVAAVAVAASQESDDCWSRQLISRPESFAGHCPSSPVVNQADLVQLVGHRRELPANGPPGEKKSVVFHDCNLAIETNRRTMDFQRTANSVLTVCLTPGAHPNWSGLCANSDGVTLKLIAIAVSKAMIERKINIVVVSLSSEF